MESPAPRIRKIVFSNAPANPIVPETVSRLHEVVTELSEDAQVHVVVFTSSTPGFFFNHFDLAQAAEFPMPAGENPVPVWTDLVVRLSKAPFISIASVRGRTRGGGNELALACDLRYASREHALFGQPEVGTGILPGGGGSERLSRLVGRDRALEAILSSHDYDADLAERYGWVTRTMADAELDSFVDTMASRLASFDKAAPAGAKAQVNRASLPPDADLHAAYAEYADSLTCRDSRSAYRASARSSRNRAPSSRSSAWASSSDSSTSSRSPPADEGGATLFRLAHTVRCPTRCPPAASRRLPAGRPGRAWRHTPCLPPRTPTVRSVTDDHDQPIPPGRVTTLRPRRRRGGTGDALPLTADHDAAPASAHVTRGRVSGHRGPTAQRGTHGMHVRAGA
ncbi:enoyl-CoA hydratase/isomerase family protein [Streptomyces scabiei]|uniref:enoyl-CoA hydratase/isomerase family protein n=1 Tax=Streptomyces scabiei TaxID=1930 RepID=UPI00298FF537|nr:enoyl-CoA hydratase/isomerase family protein [Streptomyces scabiei]MDW8803320.1 enoyl-CoA hydratase/isomerase family protein [Streptomyces scabiei]